MVFAVRKWNKRFLYPALFGLALMIAAAVLLMRSPDNITVKLACFAGGILISLTGQVLQVIFWWRRRGADNGD